MAAGTRAAAGAIHKGGIIGTARLEMLVESDWLVRVALAVFAEKSVVALADATLECTIVVAFGRALLVHVAFMLALAITQ